MFKIKTGGEHDAHSIRKGPDGWWYLLSGNGVPILPEYFAGENSPVKMPRAGFLMRISPDWQTKEIFCHGFRINNRFGDFRCARLIPSFSLFVGICLGLGRSLTVTT